MYIFLFVMYLQTIINSETVQKVLQISTQLSVFKATDSTVQTTGRVFSDIAVLVAAGEYNLTEDVSVLLM